MENGDEVFVGSGPPGSPPPGVHPPGAWTGHSRSLLMNRMWQSDGIALPRLGYKRWCLCFGCTLAHSQFIKESSSCVMSSPMEKRMRQGTVRASKNPSREAVSPLVQP